MVAESGIFEISKKLTPQFSDETPYPEKLLLAVMLAEVGADGVKLFWFHLTNSVCAEKRFAIRIANKT